MIFYQYFSFLNNILRSEHSSDKSNKFELSIFNDILINEKYFCYVNFIYDSH